LGSVWKMDLPNAASMTELNESAFMQERVMTCCMTMIRWEA
jgi:hypothetical protein